MRPTHGIRVGLAVAAATAALLLSGCTGSEAPSEPSASSAPTASPTPDAPRFALAELQAIRVPELCGHPAGVLVDGRLPGIPEAQGRVMLAPLLAEDVAAGAEESDGAVIGADAAGEPFLAATLYCDQGGVSWPNVVVVWDADRAPVATFHAEELTGGDREQIWSLSPADAGFHARWTAPAAEDAACCHQLSVEAEVAVDLAAGTAAAGEPVVHRGEEQVRAVAEAALAGEPVPDGIQIAAGLVDGLVGIRDKGWTYDLDGIACQDSSDMQRSLVCGIPVAKDGEELAFVVYPARGSGWNVYDIPSFELELY